MAADSEYACRGPVRPTNACGAPTDKSQRYATVLSMTHGQCPITPTQCTSDLYDTWKLMTFYRRCAPAPTHICPWAVQIGGEWRPKEYEFRELFPPKMPTDFAKSWVYHGNRWQSFNLDPQSSIAHSHSSYLCQRFANYGLKALKTMDSHLYATYSTGSRAIFRALSIMELFSC